MDHRLVIISMSLWIPGHLAEINNTSADSVHFRLVGGASRCQGNLEMKQLDKSWKPVEGLTWHRKLGNRVCAELDCGSAVSVRNRWRDSFMDSWWIRPNCDNATLSNCFISRTHLYSFLELNCSDSVRLVHGSSLCSGRLEVRSDQFKPWSSVCEGHLDLRDAQVICRELGCGAPGLLQGVLCGEAEAPLWETSFQCEGHESALLDCGSSVSNTCSSGRAVNITCTDPDDVKLVGGISHCEGLVQIKHDGEWRHMEYGLSYYDPWTLKAADVICRRLDCGSAVSGRTSSRGGRIWSISPSCFLSTSTLRDCVTTDTGPTHHALFVTCSEFVRLVHGSNLCSGRLEVRSYESRSWFSMCEEDLDLKVAQVVCRELGCGAPSLLQGGLFGEGEALVWNRKLKCKGDEAYVSRCRKFSAVRKNCSTGTTAGLTCKDGVTLVGQPSRCAGILMIQQQKIPVFDEYKLWDLKSGSAVCQHLNCGSAVSVNTKYNSLSSVGFISVSCAKLKSGLRDCVGLHSHHTNPSPISSVVNVVCSDLLHQPIISLSVSTDGVSEVYQQGFRLLLGSDFTITCSIKPQYSGGSFQLISNTKKPLNYTLLAVNHSAHFLLSAAGYTHRGDYTCVYHVDVFNHSFSSSQSPVLYLTVAASVTDLIIRVVVIVLALLIFDISLFFFYKVSVRRIRMKANTSIG